MKASSKKQAAPAVDTSRETEFARGVVYMLRQSEVFAADAVALIESNADLVFDHAETVRAAITSEICALYGVNDLSVAKSLKLTDEETRKRRNASRMATHYWGRVIAVAEAWAKNSGASLEGFAKKGKGGRKGKAASTEAVAKITEHRELTDAALIDLVSARCAKNPDFWARLSDAVLDQGIGVEDEFDSELAA